MTDPIWTLDEARTLVLELQPVARSHGYEVGLTGGVLYTGISTKDIDIILYPRTTAKHDRGTMQLEMMDRGWSVTRTVQQVHETWKALGDHKDKYGANDDTKQVEEWSYGGKRVDLFWLS